MCNDSEKKYYVMDPRGEVAGPYPEERARHYVCMWNRDFSHLVPHRVVTIVATEVPEPPKVSRVVRNRPYGFEYRFCGTTLQARINGSEWKDVSESANRVLSNYANSGDNYPFVRDFAALCEEVLGGGK